jgi:hypothetical protein
VGKIWRMKCKYDDSCGVLECGHRAEHDYNVACVNSCYAVMNTELTCERITLRWKLKAWCRKKCDWWHEFISSVLGGL